MKLPLMRNSFNARRDPPLDGGAADAQPRRPGGRRMRGFCRLLAIAAAMGAPVAASPAAGQGVAGAPGPSFDCARAMTGVERMICTSPELQALDLGVSIFYASARRGTHAARTLREQRAWLRDRDACASPACLRTALAERLWRLSETVSRDLPAYSDEDADAELVIADLGAGWYAFGAVGYWHGPTVNSAAAAGAFRLQNDRGEVAAASDEECALTLTRLPRDRWRIVANPSLQRMPCGGMNATVEGTYSRGRR
jgi:uncharacterized protein